MNTELLDLFACLFRNEHIIQQKTHYLPSLLGNIGNLIALLHQNALPHVFLGNLAKLIY